MAGRGHSTGWCCWWVDLIWKRKHKFGLRWHLSSKIATNLTEFTIIPIMQMRCCPVRWRGWWVGGRRTSWFRFIPVYSGFSPVSLCFHQVLLVRRLVRCIPPPPHSWRPPPLPPTGRGWGWGVVQWEIIDIQSSSRFDMILRKQTPPLCSLATSKSTTESVRVDPYHRCKLAFKSNFVNFNSIYRFSKRWTLLRKLFHFDWTCF